MHRGVRAGRLRERVAFDYPIEVPDGHGGTETAFCDDVDAYKCAAEFRYSGGREVVIGPRLDETATIKVRIRKSATAKTITGDWRMRDRRTGTAWNVRTVDIETDQQSVWITAERGVAI